MKRRFITVLILMSILLPGMLFPGTARAIDTVTIMEIQGDGLVSPLVGNYVTTQGVVTLISTDGESYWIQDPNGDNDPTTSDGLFVFCGMCYGRQPVKIGDLVELADYVSEYAYGNDQPVTEFSYPSNIKIISSGNSLPAPIPLIDLPNESIQAGIDFWEPLEGMLVSIENGFVVAPTSAYGEFAMLTEADADADLDSGYYAQTKQILILGLGKDSEGKNLVDYNPERILVDDSTIEIDDPIMVMPGDRVRSLVGVVDYTFGNYKLQPASYDVKTHNRPKMPVSTRSGPSGDTVITTFNVENLFDLKKAGLVDAIGQVGFDPGSEWGSGEASTQNNTLRRRSTVCQGDPIDSDPFDPSSEWDGFAQDTFGGLGTHSVDCGTAEDLFISEYVEGSSNNKAIEIYNGTGSPVNLGANGYAIDIYFNGNTSPGTTVQLVGTLAPNDVYVVADDGAEAAILAVADQTSTANFFNGDDAVILRKAGKDDASSTPTEGELETKLTKLALAIRMELELPEIIVVQEVENQAILQELGDRVNAAAGTDYVATSFETSDARGIEPGFLWDANRVDLLAAYQMSGPDVEAAFGPSSPSPGREPIVGVFEIGGQEVTIVGNHFKSKSGDDALFGVNWPPIRVTEVQRKAQARVVRDFVNTILDDDPEALVMVAGDLNDFQFGEPGEGSDHPVSILEGGTDEVPMADLINLEKDAERYTYVYDGNSQVLDHMLVSPALLETLVAVDVLHFDASYPENLVDDATTPLKVSDHDPLEGRFRLLR